MSKLEWIYHCCVEKVSEELQLFWRQHETTEKQMFIDPDNR